MSAITLRKKNGKLVLQARDANYSTDGVRLRSQKNLNEASDRVLRDHEVRLDLLVTVSHTMTSEASDALKLQRERIATARNTAAG